MDIEHRLRRLEARYSLALRAAVAAKAHYIALLEEPSSMPEAKRHARERWLCREATKRALAARMGEVESFDQNAVI